MCLGSAAGGHCFLGATQAWLKQLQPKPSLSQHGGEEETLECAGAESGTALAPTQPGTYLCYQMLMHLCTETLIFHAAHGSACGLCFSLAPVLLLGAAGCPPPAITLGGSKRPNKCRAARPPLTAFTPRNRLLATRTLLSVLGAGLRHAPIPCFSCMGV